MDGTEGRPNIYLALAGLLELLLYLTCSFGQG